MFWPVTVLQGSALSLYSVQVDAFSNIGASLSSDGKCRTAKVNNELTSSFLLNWRNPGRKLFIYWMRLTVKIACLVGACLNGTNDFRKAEKAWKMMIARPSTYGCYRWQHWKSARFDSKRPRVGCSSSSWGSQFGQGKCSTNSKGRIEHEKGLCKNGSKTAVRWTKRTSQGIVFGPFATHWELTRFVEFDNYLWWNFGIYVWSGNEATVNAVEVNIISKTKKKNTHWSFQVQGHVDCFLWYPGYCDGRAGTKRPDGKSTVLHWNLDEIAWKCEKETTGIMEKRVDFWKRTTRQPTTQCLWSNF